MSTKRPSSDRKKLAVTTGDVDGIGLEITYKALFQLPKRFFKKNIFYIYTHASSEKKFIKKLKQDFDYIAVLDDDYNSTDITQVSPSPQTEIVLIESASSPADWVFQVAELCKKKFFSAMITAPLSKTLIKNSGYREVGHTEILKRVVDGKNLYMFFVGRKFSVVLLTGHIPLSQASKELLDFKDKDLISELLKIRNLLPLHKRNLPFAWLGFNPHAGEEGILGGAEERFLSKLFHSQKFLCSGPLVPDVAFQKANWHRYSIYISLYHDQGLIPFKLVHGQDSGVHITLGLPFVRTSVDHGTAKDIFGKNMANANSMIEAIHWAVKLIDF